MNNVSLTPSQLHLWKSQAISANKPLFNQIITVDFFSRNFTQADHKALTSAWLIVQQLHPVLSSTIQVSAELNPTQRYENSPHDMEIVQLPNDADSKETAVQEWVLARGSLRFELDSKMVDAVLLVQNEHKITLYLNMHHLIVDAQSTKLVIESLFKEFERLKTRRFNDSTTSAKIETDNNFYQFAQQLENSSAKIKTESATTNTYAQQNSGAESLPVFYGNINHHPVTDSSRYCLWLSENEQLELSALSQIKELRQFNINLFLMCLHTTALALYLHKVTDDNLIVLEAPLTGRFDKRWKYSVGNFIEMVRFEIEVSNSLTLLELFQRVRDTIFVVLRESTAGSNSVLKSGKVHGVINMIGTLPKSGSSLANHISWHHSGHSDLHHPLRLHISDWNGMDTPTVEIDVNHGFFPIDTRERIAEHFIATYRALIKDRTSQINDISLVTDAELWRFRGSSTEKTQNSFESVLDRINSKASSASEALAIIGAGGNVTYRDVLNQTQAIAHYLQSNEIGKGQRVAVLLHRDNSLPIALLGILRSGATFIPIDHAQPTHRIMAILNDADVACVIVNQQNNDHMLDSVRTISIETILSSSNQNVFDAASDNDQVPQYGAADTLLPAVQPSDPAYIIFTSGSTGKPKGVVVSHGALASYLGWAEAYYALAEPLVMPLHTSISFDMTITSLFLPLIDGGSIRVFPEHDKSAALITVDVMSDPVVNTIKLTPSHLSLLITEFTPGKSIKQLIVGGEDLKNSTAQHAASLFTHPPRIINEYGPTEATVGCVVHEWNKQQLGSSVPIGLPIANMSTYVLNDNKQPQFEGMPGELYLSGDSLASGYWKNDNQAAEVFLDDPWRAGDKMYKTGDLVRIEKGQLTYLGRQDTQIKRNGYRIELVEIESAIASHPAITECVVTVADQTDQATSIAAFTENEIHCVKCGLSNRHPDGRLDEHDVCTLCTNYESNRVRVDEYFKTTEILQELVDTIKANRRGKYDAVVLLSGGKDSTYAISRLVDSGLKVYAFSLDNGFISDQAKANISAVCSFLNIDHHYASSEHMNDIFADSLNRYSNVCHGCFKTIYNLALEFADKHSIDYIFTGLSRGQLFETRLNNELFSDRSLSIEKIDIMVQAARIQYHAIEDAPNKLLAIDAANTGKLADKIAIIDFYRYCHVELSDMLEYLKVRVGWVRPPDTGRSTNCLINDVGIHVHKLEQGYHNYSLPYSWDVRLGHKKRSESLEELDDTIDNEQVRSILSTINYEPKQKTEIPTVLNAFYTSDQLISQGEMRSWLEERLPTYMHPDSLSYMDSMPLNNSGKIDRLSLSNHHLTPLSRPELEPLSSIETLVADIWRKYIHVPSISKHDNFFKIGGDSLSAIRCVVDIRKLGYSIEPVDLFTTPHLDLFSKLLRKAEMQAPVTEQPAPEKFSSLDSSQREKLQALLARSKSKQS